MVVSVGAAGAPSHGGTPGAAPATPDRVPRAVVWHDLECGGYGADLELWRELAARADAASGAAILEVGAGTGRVALDLVGRGHHVTALDIDRELLGALRERAGALAVAGSAGGSLTTVCADARKLGSSGADPLERSEYDLCIAAMQTVQLLGGASGRAAFLSGAHARLRPGGILACAIVTDLDEFDCRSGDDGPSAERVRLGDTDYSSRAVRVSVGRDEIAIEREREVRPDDRRGGRGSSEQGRERERNVVTLDRLDADTLAGEGAAAGLHPLGTRTVPATRDHVASAVVILGA